MDVFGMEAEDNDIGELIPTGEDCELRYLAYNNPSQVSLLDLELSKKSQELTGIQVDDSLFGGEETKTDSELELVCQRTEPSSDINVNQPKHDRREVEVLCLSPVKSRNNTTR